MIKKIAIVAMMAMGLAACTRVSPGETGVRVNNYGEGAGVESNALGVGTYSEMFGVDIYKFPTTVQTLNYARGTAEGEANNEIPFQDKNGLIVTGDVTISYHVDPSNAPKLFQIYKLDTDNLMAGPVRNKVRAAVVAAASSMTVEDIYGPGKTRLINAAAQSLRTYFEPRGLVIDGLDWAGPIRIPENIVERINARAQTEQARVAALARVATEKANGEAEVAKAQAEAAAKIARAEGDAEATRRRNAAVAANPGYQDEYLRKWDGRLPQTIYCSQDKPCLNIGN